MLNELIRLQLKSESDKFIGMHFSRLLMNACFVFAFAKKIHTHNSPIGRMAIKSHEMANYYPVMQLWNYDSKSLSWMDRFCEASIFLKVWWLHYSTGHDSASSQFRICICIYFRIHTHTYTQLIIKKFSFSFLSTVLERECIIVPRQSARNWQSHCNSGIKMINSPIARNMELQLIHVLDPANQRE